MDSVVWRSALPLRKRARVAADSPIHKSLALGVSSGFFAVSHSGFPGLGTELGAGRAHESIHLNLGRNSQILTRVPPEMISEVTPAVFSRIYFLVNMLRIAVHIVSREKR